MPELITIQNKIERRTYLKGKFTGKFIGYLDYKKSDIKHEKFYDLEVLSGEITTQKKDLHHWQTGEPIEYQPIDKFLTKLPEQLPCTIIDENNYEKYYKINLNEPKLSSYSLSNQHYEGDKMFGTIEGEISGYIQHYDTEEVEVLPDEKGELILPKPIIVKTNKQTGKTQMSGNYKRWEYYNSDGSTYWGEWIYQGKTGTGFSLWAILIGLLQILFFLFVVIPIFLAGARVIIPLLIIGVIFYLFSLLQPVFSYLGRWLIRLMGLAFLLFLISGLISLFKSPLNNTVRKIIAEEDITETTIIEKDPEVFGDSIISHHRIWEDYRENTFSGDLQVNLSDFRNASNFRNSVNYSVSSTIAYNNIISEIYDFDKNKLPRIYTMFDSLKMNNNLNDIQFVEMIASCIQDIPYTLILESDCNASYYNDNFISNYLAKGGKCEGFIKFGLLTPVEFMATLYGDCDTRTLLLFTTLNHYGYDVAMFGSEFYKHSVIGINLPYDGQYKIINGKRYVIWETTQRGLPPGVFPREFSDMRFWNVNLISNNQSI